MLRFCFSEYFPPRWAEMAFTGISGWKKLVPFVWRYSREARWWLFAAALVGVVDAGLASVAPLITSRVFDSLVRFNRTGFLQSLATLFTVSLGALFTSVSASWCAINFEERTACLLRREAFAGALQTPSGEIEPGDAMSRIANDTGALKSVISQAVLNPALDFTKIVFYTVLLQRVDRLLALVLFSCTPFTVMVAQWMRPRIERFVGVARQAVGSLFGLGVNWLSEAQFTQDYNLESVAREAANAKSKEVARTALNATWFAATSVTLSTLITSLFQISVLGLGGWRVLGGHLTVGQLLAFQIYAAMLVIPVQRLLRTATLDSASLMPFYDRIARLFNVGEPTLPWGMHILQHGSNLRQVASLTLTPGSHRTASGLTFELPEVRVKRGQILAIAGRNAAGKTTLLRSMVRDANCRLLQAEFNDVPLDLPRGLLAPRLLAYMAQKPAIAPGTLLDNLTLFSKQADLSRVHSICANLSLDSIVNQLPQGLESELTPLDLARFSGGEMRRIGLARVLYQQPEIILIDEPTAGLDHASRKLFREVLLRLKFSGKILVLITHEPDLESIADAVLHVEPDENGIRRCVVVERPIDVDPELGIARAHS